MRKDSRPYVFFQIFLPLLGMPIGFRTYTLKVSKYNTQVYTKMLDIIQHPPNHFKTSQGRMVEKTRP